MMDGEVPVDPGGASGAFDIRRAFDELAIESRQLLYEMMRQTRMGITLSDPNRPDNPLVYCNRAFLHLTGYEPDEVIGRNCRFLQGSRTSAEGIAKLRRAIDSRDHTVIELLNYRKDGSRFWNAVHIGPVYHSDGRLAYFFGSQWDMTELHAARDAAVESQSVTQELHHRAGNLFSVLSAIVRLSEQGSDSVADLSNKVQRRIEALAKAHKASLAAEMSDASGTDLRSLVDEVMQPYRNAHETRLRIAGPSVLLSKRLVTPIGLSVHELATNAIKYGALSQRDGTVHVDWEVVADRLQIYWTEHRGSDAGAIIVTPSHTGTGKRLIEGVLRSVGGTVESHFEADGLTVHLALPLDQETRPRFRFNATSASDTI